MMKAALKGGLRGLGHGLLAPLEAQLLRRHPEPRWPHVFILGAPRSGTSLFYELMATGYRFAFFSNLAHRFYKTPAAASRMGRRPIAARSSAYRSDYGHIPGWAAPNEGGWIWQRWLEDGDWACETALPGLPAEEMRATLAAVSAVFGAPFLNKNVMHSNRIRLLDALFPGCLFIEVRRDPGATARSIIRAQRHRKGPAPHADDWWSVRPSNAGGRGLVERACRQVAGVAADIARDSAHLNRSCLHRVQYETLCEDPGPVLAEAAAFLAANGVPAAPRQPVPRHFGVRPSKPLEAEEEARLQACLAETGA
ncbi:sulfotransferase (plasmid) [Roseobacteraceae bacterium NS-SX3]